MKRLFNISFLFFILIIACGAFGQGKPYEGPDDPAGDIAWERAGTMNGNRVLLYFENNTQIADYPRINTSKWPNDYTGTRMLDVVSVMIGGEVYLKNECEPVTDPLLVAQLSAVKQIDTLFYIQSSSFSPANMDRNYDGTVEWGFYPVPGYLNPLQDYPAMSNKPDSWPLKGWPSTGLEKKWPGEWDGRFGRGIHYADLETYFVANDAQDMEYIIQRNDPQERLITKGLRYYPRPGKVIGYNDPDVTIQRGYPWGGLGLRVSVRGFQWNNPEAKDMIFWEYNISNISDYDLITCGFGYFIDNSIGGDTGGDKEEGAFDDVLDLCYVWESIGVGEGGLIPGVVGIAYLESPGRAYDSGDNDEDGLIDEKRDNPAGALVGPTDGIANLDNFLRFYHYKPENLHPHYEGDEDQDWQDGYDKNGNGVYAYQGANGMWYLEDGEYPGDDVGLDGVGPLDINYNGPDEGECNHRPDFIEGVGCEPNFAAVDVSEADMIGLTSFALFDWPQWQSMNYFIGQDRTMWKLMDSHNLDTYIYSGGPGSVYEVFASTPFPFYKGRTERISMGIMFTRDNLAQLRAPGHYAPKMFRLKETAQLIYERDYRFAQPPILPKLRATAGDGKVILTWDDLADKRTHEPFLQNVNDFEGYKLYRATDKMFSDAELITTGQGDKFAKVPLFQCDLIDHIQGYADYGIVEGVAYYLGDDTGIRHYYIDDDVKNGVTYYYAIVAYDYGIPEFGVSPTENNVVIELNEAEEIVRIGQNVAVVTPHARAAGYLAPNIVIDQQASSPTVPQGLITPAVVDIGHAQKNHTYEITFTADVIDYLRGERYRHPLDGQLLTNGFQVWDVTGGKRELVYEETPNSFPEDHLYYDADAKFWRYRTDAPILTDIFDGIQLTVDMSRAVDSVMIDYVNSGWITGNSPIEVLIGPETKYFPYEYEIVFTGSEVYRTKTSVISQIRDVFDNPLRRNDLLLNVSYPFYVRNLASVDSTGEYEKLDLLTHDLNGNGVYDWDQDLILAGHAVNYMGKIYWAGTVLSIDMRNAGSADRLPKPNDVYRLRLIRPLTSADKLVFTVSPEDAQNVRDIKTTMDSIKVVPNPYIATNEMEPAVANKYLNQRRRIMFTHIPAQCKIRIFTVSGVLVDEIDVNNEPENGAVHWDLLSREGLEIAAGMYIFHVKSKVSGDEKVGKFAVIK
ncbi:MAG: hypothetical protein ONB12_00950 [candidate division KSB1 bacterium]|nr:hypothetical protein [candidate division KSB1 bacterium]